MWGCAFATPCIQRSPLPRPLVQYPSHSSSSHSKPHRRRSNCNSPNTLSGEAPTKLLNSHIATITQRPNMPAWLQARVDALDQHAVCWSSCCFTRYVALILRNPTQRTWFLLSVSRKHKFQLSVPELSTQQSPTAAWPEAYSAACASTYMCFVTPQTPQIPIGHSSERVGQYNPCGAPRNLHAAKQLTKVGHNVQLCSLQHAQGDQLLACHGGQASQLVLRERLQVGAAHHVATQGHRLAVADLCCIHGCRELIQENLWDLRACNTHIWGFQHVRQTHHAGPACWDGPARGC